MAKPSTRTLVVPADFILDDDEIRAILGLAARAKRAGDADLALAYSNATLSKRILTIRSRGSGGGLAGGTPMPTEF